jgi:hypothetical protein
MASWEAELARLLRELGVTQEEPKTHLRPTYISEPSNSQDIPFLHPGNTLKRHVQSADSLFWGGADKDEIVDGDAHMGELRMMRRRIESIVSQVEYLIQQDDIDASFKEDVLIVLRALRRRAMVTQQAAASETAYLEFAAAMLHFCRLVLRLSPANTDET